MITNVRQAVGALPVGEWDAERGKVSEVVEFLKNNPDEFADFCREVREASDAANHITPYYRLKLVLKEALKVR